MIEYNRPEVEINDIIKVQIFNIADSRLMHEEEMRNFGNNYQLNLNISNFSQGVYLVVVDANDNKYYSKFVKH